MAARKLSNDYTDFELSDGGAPPAPPNSVKPELSDVS